MKHTLSRLALAAAIAGTGLAAQAELPKRADVLAKISLIADKRIKDKPTPKGITRHYDAWIEGTLHVGMLAANDVTGIKAYRAYAETVASASNWKISAEHADAFMMGEVYLGLTSEANKLHYLGSASAEKESLVGRTNDIINRNDVDNWSWIDAVHMQMNSFTELGNRLGNGDHDYHGHMYKMFDDMRGRRALYDTTDHLWYRDSKYKWPDHQSPNGKKVYWSRGNGWVFVSLARTLETLSPSDAHYSDYKTVFVDMANAMVARQREDGFLSANLGDADHLPGIETTGTAALLYGLAAGLRMGILVDSDKHAYTQAVEKAWNGLTQSAIDPKTGHVGFCQPVGEEPKSASQNETSSFCVGLVLRAASELSRITTESKTNYALKAPVTTSSAQPGNEGKFLVDGVTTGTAVGTRWAAQGYPQWAQVDLGSAKTLTRTALTPHLSRAYQYKIEGSLDGSTYTLLADRSANVAGATTLFDVFAPTSVRYVKITVTGATAYSNGGDWVSLKEFSVSP